MYDGGRTRLVHLLTESSLRAAQSLQGQLVSEQQLMDAIPAVHNVKGKKERQRDKGMNRERERE